MNYNVNTMVNFCKNHFDLNQVISYDYHSLPVCIIDCVYSLRVHYDTTTKRIIDRYARKYLNGDVFNSTETISDLLSHFDELNSKSDFSRIINNKQKLGKDIPKESVCYDIAKYLSYLHIESLNDFLEFEDKIFLEKVLRSVKGFGSAGVNYLFMLTGDIDRCKIDTHISQFMNDIFGDKPPENEIYRLFKEAVKILKNEYPGLNVRNLDGIVWRYYQSKKDK